MSDPTQSSSSVSRLSSSSGNQSLRWSLQNFPVPVQLQARIPRSPLAVAQELLPNFPSQLTQQIEAERRQQQQTHQYHMSLQQHIQQQLQQQFQRQLQLNLQGGGNDEPTPLPDPPDTVLDLDTDSLPPSTSFSNPGTSDNNGGGSGSGLRAGISSTNFLETLLRGAQAASLQQRNNSSNSQNEIAGVNGSSSTTSPLHSHSHGHHHSHLRHLTSGNSPQPSSSGGAGDGTGNAVTGLAAAQNTAGGGGGDVQAGLQPTSDISLLTHWAAQSGVFILLLLLHFLYDHRLGLLVFLCLGGTFYYTNMKLVHAIHQSAVRKQNLSGLGLLNLVWLCGFLTLNISLLYYVFADQQLWRLLFFQMATVTSIPVWTLLWCVVLTDYIVKFMTIILKAFVAMMQPFCRNYRKRGKYYLLIESISQLYRQLITVVPWLYYLNDNTRTSMWFALLTEIVYLVFKSWSLWAGAKFFYNAMLRFSSNTTFGTKPSSSDMLERGGQCPICQDSINEPVMLACKHIFCEQCVSIWLDREKTCPMCRAEITTESPEWKDGNTSAHLQWH